jgi:acyl carrier protein
VIHAVGLLDDGALLQQSWDRFARVFAPKILGTWHLHALTKELPLDFFVLFSSGASVLGNRGQANHAGANAFLDAFAYYRRAQGLPALSINWGAWAEIGAAANLVRQNQQQMAAAGQGVISPALGIAALAQVMGGGATQVVVLPTTWEKFLAAFNAQSPFLSNFAIHRAAPTLAPSPTVTSLRAELAVAPPAQRRQRLLTHLQNQAAAILGMQQLPAIKVGLTEMGLDSLMAIELRKRLEKSLEMALPSTIVFTYPTIDELQQFLAQELFVEAADEAIPPPATANGTESTAAMWTDAGVDEASLEELDLLAADALMAEIADRFQSLG